MTCNHTTATTGSIAATTFSILQQTQLLHGQVAIDKTWLCTQPTKRPNFSSLPCPILFSSSLLFVFVFIFVLSCLLSSLVFTFYFLLFCAPCNVLDFAFNPDSLSSLWFDFIQKPLVSMKRRPSSELWKQIFGIGSLWVVVQRRKTEGCVQIVRETECRILQGEREREREREWRIWTFFSVSCLRVFILLSWRCSRLMIYYILCNTNTWYVKFIWSQQNKR